MNIDFVSYLSVLSFLLVADYVWLSKLSASFYRKRIGGIMRDKVDLRPAAAFYLLYAAGLLFFVLGPLPDSASPAEILFRGGFFGLTAYAAYDLTNQATLKGWSWQLSLLDMAWGSLLSAAAACFAYIIN
jgi:uncharacterized membrane protein